MSPPRPPELRRWAWQNIDPRVSKIYRGWVKVRDLVKLLERDGWYWVRTKGSHHQYKHPAKAGIVTVPGNPGKDMAVGTLNNILKQAGLKP